MTTWETAIDFVLRMEGGAIAEHDPYDRGGLTKFGISQRAYPTMDIANITVDQAKEIYRRDYWQVCSCDDLPPGFAFAVFDTAVNMGVGTAKRMLQEALDVTVDGKIGPLTIAAATAASQRRRMKFLAIRLAKYSDLMSKNERLRRYDLNWCFRVLSLQELIFKMEGSIS